MCGKQEFVLFGLKGQINLSFKYFIFYVLGEESSPMSIKKNEKTPLTSEKKQVFSFVPKMKHSTKRFR